MPMNLLLIRFAATNVVPVPQKGSATISPANPERQFPEARRTCRAGSSAPFPELLPMRRRSPVVVVVARPRAGLGEAAQAFCFPAGIPVARREGATKAINPN
jgi:hypothetical protein